MPLKTMEADVKELRRLLGDSPDFANDLCLLAEYELKRPEPEIDWDNVARKLLSGKRLLEGKGHDRYLAQCLYFYGEYLRRRPSPRLKEAVRAYKAAEKSGARAGDFRQIGRARRRWVNLEWRQLKTLKAREACRLLEEVIPPLEKQPEDAFSMRILERLYSLRAEIGKGLKKDSVIRFLVCACRAASEPVLQSASDRDRFGRAVRRYLDCMQEEDNFPGAQGFLEEFDARLHEKLNITVTINDPWKFHKTVVGKYPDVKH